MDKKQLINNLFAVLSDLALEFVGDKPDYIIIRSFIVWCKEEEGGMTAPDPNSPAVKLAQEIVALMDPPKWFNAIGDLIEHTINYTNDEIAEFIKSGDFMQCLVRGYSIDDMKTMAECYLPPKALCDRCEKPTIATELYKNDNICNKCHEDKQKTMAALEKKDLHKYYKPTCDNCGKVGQYIVEGTTYCGACYEAQTKAELFDDVQDVCDKPN